MLSPQLVLSIPVDAFLGLLPRLKKCAENTRSLLWSEQGRARIKDEAGCENLNKSKNVSKLHGMVWRDSCTLTKA